MSKTITKFRLVESIKEVFLPVLNTQGRDGTIADALHKDTEFVDSCRGLVDDIEWMFRYTDDGETWSHVEDLMSINPFSGFLSLDTVASDGVSSFLYERAERYFKQSHIKTNDLDWFYLDFVVAVGFRVLLKDCNDKDFKEAYPSLSKAIDDFDGDNFWALIKYILISLAKNVIYFGFVIFLMLVAREGNTLAALIGGGLLFWKLFIWYSQAKLFSKLKKDSIKKLTQFNALYKLFADGYVRWDMLEYDIKRLRDQSIEFPLVVDTAITARKIQQLVSTRY